MFEDIGIKKVRDTATDTLQRTGTYFKSHWSDYVIIVFILLLLGAFDAFALKKSENLGDSSYWLHAVTRISAYALASILGIRIGYPKYKDACQELKDALTYNRRLIVLRGSDFQEFINEVNIETKKLAWKNQINKKLAKLDRRSPSFFPLYYESRDEDGNRSEEFFKNVNPKWLRDRIKKKADKYCEKRETLESLLEDDFINENIQTLNVKYPVVYKSDFDFVDGNTAEYRSYQTRSKDTQAKARAVGNSLIFTLIFTLVVGGIALDFNRAIAEEQVAGIISAVVNSIIDVGIVLFRVANGITSSEKIVRSEDLRAVVDKNELMILYCELRGVKYPKITEVIQPAPIVAPTVVQPAQAITQPVQPHI